MNTTLTYAKTILKYHNGVTDLGGGWELRSGYTLDVEDEQGLYLKSWDDDLHEVSGARSLAEALEDFEL